MDLSFKTLDSLVNRLGKIGIKIELCMNYPWIYLHKVNGIRVKEKFQSEYAYTIAFMPMKQDRNLELVYPEHMFKIIRKYNDKSKRKSIKVS